MDYTLDVKTWRCGDNGTNKLGEGATALNNREGYMCCVGQFCLQHGVQPGDMLECGIVSAIARKYPIEEFVVTHGGSHGPYYTERNMMTLLYVINDCEETTPAEKITKLREVLEVNGHTLTVINEELINGVHA